MRNPRPQPSTTSTPINVHIGAALMAFAQTYPTLREVVLECIQNALDAGGTTISVVINQRQRTIVVRDNGIGITTEGFALCLSQIGRSQKKTSKLGQFGRGAVSALDKCDELRYTSTPKDDPRNYHTWTLDPKVLGQAAADATIPVTERPDLWYGTGKGRVAWRTEVAVKGFTKDRFVSSISLDQLAQEINDRYSPIMRKIKAVVTIHLITADNQRLEAQVTARDFSGQALPDEEFGNPSLGRSKFTLFFAKPARKGGKPKGRVYITIPGREFRVAFDVFMTNLPENLRPQVQDAGQALLSGIFEGTITNYRIVLAPDRKSFEFKEPLANLCMAIAEWYEHVGKQLFKQIRNAQEDAELQASGQRSLGIFERMMHDDPAGEAVREAVSTLKIGTVAKGHTKTKGPKEARNFKEARAILDGLGDPGSSGESRSKGSPKHEKPTDTPLTTAGPKGQRRTQVHNNSLGLTIVHDPRITRLWEFDHTTGVLTISTRHPYWVRCFDRGPNFAERLQEFIVGQAVTMCHVPEPMREAVGEALQRCQAQMQAFLICEADRLAKRFPGSGHRRRKKSEKVSLA